MTEWVGSGIFFDSAVVKQLMATRLYRDMRSFHTTDQTRRADVKNNIVMQFRPFLRIAYCWTKNRHDLCKSIFPKVVNFDKVEGHYYLRLLDYGMLLVGTDIPFLDSLTRFT